MRYFTLLVVFFAITVFAHPPVSNPPRQELGSDENEIEDLYAMFPNDRPLHTTVLMSGPQPTANQGRSPELK